MSNPQTGTVLDNLIGTVTGEPCGGLPRGALIVLAGDPDADACLGLTMEAIRGGGLIALVIDATATNQQLCDEVAVLYSQKLAYVRDLLEQLDGHFWQCVVLHSLDAWDDWNNPAMVMDIAQWADRSGCSVIIHTKTLGQQPYFGDRVLRPWASVVLRVDDGGECEWLGGNDYRLER